MDVKLNLQNILKLINLYHCHPFLWDMTNKAYRRNDLKYKAYEDIAREMGMPVEVVKKKIRNLRTTYTNEKRKIKKSGSGAEEPYISTLPWFDHMSFLDNFIYIRKTVDNSAEDELNSESLEELEECEFVEYLTNEIPIKSPRNATETSMDKIYEVLEKITNENETEFAAFGTSIGQQLGNMPKEPAYELMSEIQTLICQKKLKEIRKNRSKPTAAEKRKAERKKKEAKKQRVEEGVMYHHELVSVTRSFSTDSDISDVEKIILS